MNLTLTWTCPIFFTYLYNRTCCYYWGYRTRLGTGCTDVRRRSACTCTVQSASHTRRGRSGFPLGSNYILLHKNDNLILLLSTQLLIDAIFPDKTPITIKKILSDFRVFEDISVCVLLKTTQKVGVRRYNLGCALSFLLLGLGNQESVLSCTVPVYLYVLLILLVD